MVKSGSNICFIASHPHSLLHYNHCNDRGSFSPNEDKASTRGVTKINVSALFFSYSSSFSCQWLLHGFTCTINCLLDDKSDEEVPLDTFDGLAVVIAPPPAPAPPPPADELFDVKLFFRAGTTGTLDPSGLGDLNEGVASK